MKYFGYFRSSAAYRCRIAFNLKGISPEFHPVHLRRNGGEQHQPHFLAVNPQGLVPALQVGSDTLTQSLAIIEWLDETIAEPRLLPDNPIERAQVRAFAQAIACDIHPLHNLRVLEFLRQRLSCMDADVTDWCRHWISQGLTACEQLVSQRPGDWAYCFGHEPGLADVCLVPQMASADRFGVGRELFPTLDAIDRRCRELAAFAEAAPARQTDWEA